jgi:MerR family transcriptional regulator/heat shock protein HspR
MSVSRTGEQANRRIQDPVNKRTVASRTQLFSGHEACSEPVRTLTTPLVGFIQKHMASGHRPVYVISIAAGLAGCHPRTLRIYEEEGLLEPVRTETNIRLYSDDDLQRVRVIRYLTQVRGVNLAGVKLLLHMRDATDLMEDLMRELADLAGDDDPGNAANGTDERPKRDRNEGTRF